MRFSPPIHHALILPLAALCLGLFASCQSAGSEKDDLEGATPYVPLPDEEPAAIGYFLAQYDKSLRRWTELNLAPSSERDVRSLRALERNLALRAQEREDEILAALEDGPPLNREVAAVALGFTGNPQNLSPLLAVLSDEDPTVVQKALLGIGLLSRPETPMSQITWILIHDPDPWTRNNAAYAIQRIVSAGGTSDQLAASCRDALYDEEPGVRAQVASILGILHDPEAIDPLSDLLYDEVNLVSAASARALSTIGRVELEQKGLCARALVDSLDRLEKERRNLVLGELVRLSNKNYGDDSETWKEWAYRLP